jgi:hypothetical protein
MSRKRDSAYKFPPRQTQSFDLRKRSSCEVPFIEPGREPLLEVGASNLVSLDVRSCIEIGTVPQQDRSIRGSSCDHLRKTSLR